MTPEGKNEHVGVVFRCEPTNPYDANAVRVEAMGQFVGFVSRQLAVSLPPALQRRCGRMLEARGIIVGCDNGGGDVGQ